MVSNIRLHIGPRRCALAPEEHATSVGIIPRNEFGSKAGGDELGPGVTLAGTVAMQERFRGNGGQHGCR